MVRNQDSDDNDFCAFLLLMWISTASFVLYRIVVTCVSFDTIENPGDWFGTLAVAVFVLVLFTISLYEVMHEDARNRKQKNEINQR